MRPKYQFALRVLSLCNPGIFRNLVYSEPEAISEPWYIQNPAVIRTLVYSELWHIQNPGVFRTLSNICDRSFSRK